MTAGILPGDFGLVHERNAGGRLIGVAEFLDDIAQGHWSSAARDSLYRHAFLVERVDGTTVHAIEAKPSGAGRATYSTGNPDILWSSGILKDSKGEPLSPTDAQRQAMVSWGVTHIGDTYAWSAYLRQAAVRLHVPFAASALARQVESRQQEICSQFVDCAYQAAGVHLFLDGRAPYDVAPSDLALLLS